MKKIMRTSYLLILLLTFIFQGCDLLEENPEDRFVTGNFYSGATDAVAAVNGIYNTLGIEYERLFNLKTDLITDDMKNGIGMASAALQQMEYLRLTSETGQTSWSGFYYAIARANTAINAIPVVPMDETLKKRLIGEAKFLRALYYFHLVRLYGDVPLVTKIESLADAYAPRSPKAEVYKLIIEDLTEAASSLPEKYNTVDIGRATKGAAKILLGKVHLTMHSWQLAADVLGDVVNNAGVYGYALHENFRANFQVATENGSEMVFSVQYSEPPGNGNNLMCAIAPNYSIPGGKGVPGLIDPWESDIPTIDLYTTFDDADERKAATFNRVYISPTNQQTYTSAIPLFYKYWEEGEKNCNNSDINFPILRYSDAILMYAEALNETSQTPLAETQVNRIRERAFNDQVHSYNGLSQSDLREKIKLERRLEFAHEGQRYFDLQRWGDFVTVMKAHGQKESQLAESIKIEIADNVKDFHALFPIPQHEIDLNPKLTQNTGY